MLQLGRHRRGLAFQRRERHLARVTGLGGRFQLGLDRFALEHELRQLLLGFLECRRRLLHLFLGRLELLLEHAHARLPRLAQAGDLGLQRRELGLELANRVLALVQTALVARVLLFHGANLTLQLRVRTPCDAVVQQAQLVLLQLNLMANRTEVVGVLHKERKNA